MKTKFSDFIEKAPNYKKFDGNAEAIYVFEKILSRDDSIISMIDTSESGKPALCARLLEVEDYCRNHPKSEFNLTNNFAKQALGTMVRVILEPFGYITEKQKDIPKSYKAQFVTSAMTYSSGGPAIMRVVRKIEEV
jgi:hypothetical protein